jgi:hypothetical protein
MARGRTRAVRVDTGSRGTAAPGLFLIPERDCRCTATRAEEFFGERLDNGRVIALAAENVEVGVVRIVRKMAADQGGRDQLYHGIAGNAARAKIDDLALAKTLHIDKLTQLHNIAADMVGIADQVGVTILKIEGSTESPRLPLTHHFLGSNGSGYGGF